MKREIKTNGEKEEKTIVNKTDRNIDRDTMIKKKKK